MRNDFMLDPNGLNKFSQPSQKTCRIIATVVVICFVILITGLIYYYYFVAKLAVMEVDKAATGVLEQIEKDIEEIEETERFNEWQERKWNQEFRERQR